MLIWAIGLWWLSVASGTSKNHIKSTTAVQKIQTSIFFKHAPFWPQIRVTTDHKPLPPLVYAPPPKAIVITFRPDFGPPCLHPFEHFGADVWERKYDLSASNGISIRNYMPAPTQDTTATSECAKMALGSAVERTCTNEPVVGGSRPKTCKSTTNWSEWL